MLVSAENDAADFIVVEDLKILTYCKHILMANLLQKTEKTLI